jgi:protein-disulfide isomerase
MRWRIYRKDKGEAMTKLKVPLSPHDHIQNGEDAAVTLLEYGDYQCPHCGLAYYIIKAVQDHYSDQLRFVFRNFPLAQIHPLAEPAAETAEFAGAHQRFWEMHDSLYENQERLSLPLLFELADLHGLSVSALQHALDTHEFLPRIRNDFLGGVRSGVNGTPTFFINGERHDGSYAFEDLVADIDAHLGSASQAA